MCLHNYLPMKSQSKLAIWTTSLKILQKPNPLLQETQQITQRSNNLNEYYESLRNNVITLLEHVRIPSGAAGGPPEKMGHDNFDSYLSRLQTLCGSGVEGSAYCDENNRPLYETVKSALQDFTVLPTPIWNPLCKDSVYKSSVS